MLNRHHIVIEKGIIDHHVDKLLQQGLISPSNSPWSSPVVLVKKKIFYAQTTSNPRLNPDNYRMAIDYRKLKRISAYYSPKLSLTTPHQSEKRLSNRGDVWRP
jgi:hypothetical protein